uniref:Uncharacterized protein n=1 Tax=Malurus cyaneus samueli TaxID=2593467 RepID=A0A8C5U0J4_9PASS
MAGLPDPALGRTRCSRPPLPPALSAAAMAEPAGSFHLLRAGTKRGGRTRRCAQVGTATLGPHRHGHPLPLVSPHPGPHLVRGSPSPPLPHPRSPQGRPGHRAAALSLGPGSATLRLPEEPRCPAVTLVQLPAAEARSQLQALVFGMASCIESLERRLEAAAIASLSGLANSQSWPGSAPDPSRQKRLCPGPEDTVECLCAKTRPCLHGQHQHPECSSHLTDFCDRRVWEDFGATAVWLEVLRGE